MRCLIGFLIWGYQKFYSLPPKNGFLAQSGQIWPKTGIFGQFDLLSDQKTMRTSCLGGFSIMWVPKRLLPPIEIRIFGQKTANLVRNMHFWSIWAKYLHFLPISSLARPNNNANKVPRWVFCYVGNKSFPSPVKIRIFSPKTTKFGPKLAFLPAHLVPCWWVCWWLWRTGCISQDTYLLYGISDELHFFLAKRDNFMG